MEYQVREVLERVGADAYLVYLTCPQCKREHRALLGRDPGHRDFHCGCGLSWHVEEITDNVEKL